VGIAVLLVDTHIFLWWLFDDPRLPEAIRGFLKNGENKVHVSVASVWEIATKARLGKLPEAGSVAQNVPYWIQRAGFEKMNITPEHAQLAGSWDIPHRDPFDRMLAAQSKLERIPLASVDSALSLFPISIVST